MIGFSSLLPNFCTGFALGVINNVGVSKKLNFKCLLHILRRTGNGRLVHSKLQLLCAHILLCHQQKLMQVYRGARGGESASAGENGRESALGLHPGKDLALVLHQQV